jgi:hypothetical protein
MGCGREIAERRAQLSRKPVPAALMVKSRASIGDVVRYLRRQDDVVVPQENSEFLVNGRFQMPLPDLVAHANQMRGRQGKPAFELENTTAGPAARLNIANGQALS